MVRLTVNITLDVNLKDEEFPSLLQDPLVTGKPIPFSDLDKVFNLTPRSYYVRSRVTEETDRLQDLFIAKMEIAG